MIYPNIQIISKHENIYFCDYLTKSLCRKTYRYDSIIKNFKFDKYTAFVVVSQTVKNYKNVIHYLKNKNFKSVYYFIDDIFRKHLNNSFLNLDTEYAELKIINKIIKKTNIDNYKIFHCEKNTEFENLNYADLFLYHWINLYKIDHKGFSNKFEYSLSCFNNRKDIHRHIISSLLFDKKDVFLTINDFLSDHQIFKNNFINFEDFDDNLRKKIVLGTEYLKNNKKKFTDPGNKKCIPISFNVQNNFFVTNVIKNSFVNVVTETTFTSNSLYISEKTLKPMMCLRPFVMLGPPGTINQLKELGFITFEKWWDESYDTVCNHSSRLQKVYYILEDILSKSKTEKEKILIEMKDILEHNFLHINNLKKNLLPII
jgi:hypothetical protein